MKNYTPRYLAITLMYVMLCMMSATAGAHLISQHTQIDNAYITNNTPHFKFHAWIWDTHANTHPQWMHLFELVFSGFNNASNQPIDEVISQPFTFQYVGTSMHNNVITKPGAPAKVPEPASLILMMVGFFLLWFAKRRGLITFYQSAKVNHLHAHISNTAHSQQPRR